VDPVCDLLHDKDLESLQPLLASGLSLLAAQNLPRIQRRLQDATGSAARHILAAVANSPYPEANRVIALAAGHKEPRVRKEAIKALVNRRALDRPESKKCISMALEDKDPQVRAAALLALRENPTEEIGAHLLEIVEGPRFKETPQAERVIFFETLVRLPGKAVRNQLREWTTKPIWWPNSDQVERRMLAARALVRSIDPADRELLEKHARSLFPGIRKACRQALQGAPTLSDTPGPPPDPAGDSQ
jgi:HEAT repeat protein